MLNPFAFRPGPVTFWTTVTYLALLTPLVIINENTPPAPAVDSPLKHISLTQAWLDLATLTKGYHPYNSHYNDELREFLLHRIRSILDENGVDWVEDTSGSASAASKPDAAVTLFDDMSSNCTFLMSSGVVVNPNTPQVAAYFEGTNILVYIRGKADGQGRWWDTAGARDARRSDKGLTLVNAHYDSVSTGYGATDDGMGVVTCLQLIQYFSHPDNQPERGIVVMLNNGEEDYLYGARALGQHPLNPYIHTFLNLEGAGAGGRAILFRSTDREVTAAYAGSPAPFGTVIGSDAFGLGFIRSGTDYSVLYDVFGQRGLDLAFFKPRARYHTNQDDARHASTGSLWHMLSAAIHTTTRLSRDTGNTFIGPRPDGARGKVHNGRPSDGVWFDLFGKGFVLFGLRGMFAWSLTALIATPLVLLLVSFLLHRADKYYLFSSAVKTGNDLSEEDEAVAVGGWKGFFRFPFALVVAGSLTFGAAFLVRKINPFIIYGNQYSVLAMMVSLFYFSFWCIMRGANFARPSALHRVYAHVWLFTIGWAMLVAVTVAEDRLRIGAGYMFVFFQSAVALSLLLALCELFALPKKGAWAWKTREEQDDREFYRGRSNGALSPNPQSPPPASQRESSPPGTRHSNNSLTLGTANAPDDSADADTPTERTPLIAGPSTPAPEARTTFATTYRRSITAIATGVPTTPATGGPFPYEQPWSSPLPSWAWFPQFLLVAPVTAILAAQTALMLVDAVHQTGADGSSLLLPYLIAALAALLLVLPLAPFVHRVSHHLPLGLLVVAAGTLVWNLTAQPFGEAGRYKVYFVQTVEMEKAGEVGGGRVCYNGIEGYVREIIASLPTAAGREVECGKSKRQGLVACCFDGEGLEPRLRLPGDKGVEKKEMVRVGTEKIGEGRARIEIEAVNTKACFVEFDEPVAGLRVEGGSAWDERFGQFPDGGVKNVRLWRRKWEGPWVVEVEWNGEAAAGVDEKKGGQEDDDGEDRGLKTRRKGGLAGTVTCMWSDANVEGTIPALDEALQFVPAWVAVSKLSEGLVEGRKRFEV